MAPSSARSKPPNWTNLLLAFPRDWKPSLGSAVFGCPAVSASESELHVRYTTTRRSSFWTKLPAHWMVILSGCLLYTSDAADERSSVDLGGRRIIKKKKKR